MHGDPLHDGYFARARLGVHLGMRFGASATRRYAFPPRTRPSALPAGVLVWGHRLAWSRPFLHSGSAKGQFSRSLAELLFAFHRAAQSKLRGLRGRLGPEPMRRAMKSTRLRLAAGGAEWVAVMHLARTLSPIAVRGHLRLRAARTGILAAEAHLDVGSVQP